MNNETKRTRLTVQDMVRLSVLVAIMLLLELTGLGMIKTAGLEITIFLVPVIVGAIVMGPGAGAFLGGVFGCISFWECFGKSWFGTMLLGISPVLTFLVCVPTRILAGWLCGLAFKALHKLDQAVDEGGHDAPLCAVAVAHYQNGHHAEQSDGTAVGHERDLDHAQNGGQRDHQCTLHQNAGLGIGFGHKDSSSQNDSTQKQNAPAFQQAHGVCERTDSSANSHAGIVRSGKRVLRTMRISAFRRPCFYVRIKVRRIWCRSQAPAAHICPVRRIGCTIIQQEGSGHEGRP